MQFINITKVRNSNSSINNNPIKKTTKKVSNYTEKCIPKEKTVYQLTLDGKLVKSYNNELDAINELNISLLQLRRIIVGLDKSKEYLLKYSYYV